MKRISQIMDRGVGRCFTAAGLLAARDGHPVLHQASGKARLDTIFDVASMTKPLATTAAAMVLCAEGKLRVGDFVRRWVPEVDRPETRTMRVSHLLDHTSGLPAWLPFYEQARNLAPAGRRWAGRRWGAATPLERRPGGEPEYSDLNLILMDWVLERCSGVRLDHFTARHIYRPLGLTRTFFVDLNHADGPPYPLAEFAPTERCPWRKKRLRAEVHDDNCHAMGGVSGHAGLFSTAYEVHLLAREFVAAYQGGRSLFDTAVVRRFFHWRRPADSPRRLGWATPQGLVSPGRFFGPLTVGHLGYTGTSLWIDLERSIWVVLLTNRVYYGRDPEQINAFRPRLHNAVMQLPALKKR